MVQTPRQNEEIFSGDDLQEMVLRLAHEVRNPLAVIKSSAQLIRRLDMSAVDALPYLESMIVGVGRIDNTIHDMERFARLQTNTACAVLVAEAAREAVATTEGQARPTGVSVAIGDGPAVRVLVDPRQFQDGLRELIDNATRFSEPDTRITVSWERGARREIHIHVDDEGCGVSEEDASRILRPFFSSSTQGTGLGLNTVQRICLLAGGRLEWRNRRHGGCRFTMILAEV